MENIIKKETYHRQQQGDETKSGFPYDYKPSPARKAVLHTLDYKFPETLSQKLPGREEEKCELRQFLIAAMALLVHKYNHNGAQTILLGIPSPQPGQPGDNGHQEPITPLHIPISDTMSFKELLQRVIEATGGRDTEQTGNGNIQWPDVVVAMRACGTEGFLEHHANMIFTFSFCKGYLNTTVAYNGALYEKTTVRRLNTYLQHLMQDVLEHRDKQLRDVDILPENEKFQLLEQFNDTHMDYPRDRTVYECFAQQVEQRPDNVAVVYENMHLTYRELDRLATRVAGYLRFQKHVRPEEPVGVWMERSVCRPAALLGILKAGAAFVPMDPALPRERIKYMINDSGMRVMISDNNFTGTLNPLLKECPGFNTYLRLEGPNTAALENLPGQFPTNGTAQDAAGPRGAAYIIYTSGTTGKPKGVVLEHRSLLNLCQWHNREFGVTHRDHAVQYAGFSFDASVWELFPYLLTGARVDIISEKIKMDVHRLNDYFQARNVSICFLPTQFCEHFMEKENRSLRVVLTGGDKLHRFIDRGYRLYNNYGPTENTVVTTSYRVTNYMDNIPIGKPLANNRVYILGNTGPAPRLQPVGAAGELCIGGEGLARGYLNQPELTAEKFVPINTALPPAGVTPCVLRGPLRGERQGEAPPGPPTGVSWKRQTRADATLASSSFSAIYKTGDLARWLPDGNIEFLGRIDKQIKIRGYRIETGEIEKQILAAEPGITDAVVTAKDDGMGEKYLCAYLVAEEAVDVPGLKGTLANNLPEYMLPAYFEHLDAIPLTPNGKVDTAVLPDPKIKHRAEDYVPPTGALEDNLIGAWAEVLHMNREIIGVHDDFFALGGHSLRAAVLVTEIHKRLNVRLQLHDIFENPTVRAQAGVVRGAAAETYASISPVEKKEYYPQSSAQKRLYFLYRMDPTDTAYNIQLLDTHYDGVVKERLEGAFKQLILRHESLRTSFFEQEGEAVQRVHDPEEINFSIEYYESSEGRTRSGGSGVYPGNERRQVADDPTQLETAPQKITYAPGSKDQSGVQGAPLSSPWRSLRMEEAAGGPPEARVSTVENITRNFVRPFELSRPPLLRVGLVKVREKRQIMLLDVHHIITDGVSMDIFMKELKVFYSGESLAPLPLQYKEFAVWAEGEKAGGAIKKQEEFWLDVFSGGIPLLDLPTDFPRPASLTFAGDTVVFRLGEEETAALNRLARRLGTTLFMVLLGSFSVLLSRLSGQRELVIGTAAAGRGHADLAGIIGMFVNTLALRLEPGEEKSFEAFLAEVKEITIAAFENQDYPFETLVGRVLPGRDPGRNPLFDVAFVLENEFDPADQLVETAMPGERKPYGFGQSRTKFDITLAAVETENDITCLLEYNASLFKRETMERMGKYFRRVAAAVAAEAACAVGGIDFLPPEEKEWLLSAGSGAEVTVQGPRTLHGLFEQQAARVPDGIAIVGPEGEMFSYGQLDREANALAFELRARGVGEGRIVALAVDRSYSMAVGIFGILKAGGAYLPIDASHPRGRIRHTLADSAAQVLVTTPGYLEPGIHEGETFHLTPGVHASAPGSSSLSSPPSPSSPSSPAYLIYTSGSTGLPKGVVVEHGGAANTTVYRRKAYGMGTHTSALNFLSYTFDGFVVSFFTPMASGARLVLMAEDHLRDIGRITSVIVNLGITYFAGVPPLYAAILDALDGEDGAIALEAVTLAGDKLPPGLMETSRKVLPGVEVAQEYGVTEASVMSTIYRHQDRDPVIKIGAPIDNTQVYILDSRRNLQPTGVPGELCIGGTGVARGYLNKPELTAERFVCLRRPSRGALRGPSGGPSGGPRGGAPWTPYCPSGVDWRRREAEQGEGAMYHTGDLARWLPDGNIQFLGRIDRQVKIRGFRIELGEIESKLNLHEAVKEAAVTARTDRGKEAYLCAYVVWREQPVEGLDRYLSRHLPGYMVPAYFVEMERLPLSSNGKVDVKVLPEPVTRGASGGYLSPRDDKERVLAETWQEVLGGEPVGIHDDFFTLGGDSIKALRIISLLKKHHLGLDVALLFQHKTVARLAPHLRETAGEQAAGQGTVTGPAPLTPIQHWFFDIAGNSYRHFNQSILAFRKKGFRPAVLSRVFTRLIEHHDALRMVYRPDGSGHEGVDHEDIQVNRGLPEHSFQLEIIALPGNEPVDSHETLTSIRREADRVQRGFRLQEGPLLKAVLFRGSGKGEEGKEGEGGKEGKEGEGGDYLLIVVHHLVVDGVSWRILLEDFQGAYRLAAEGGEIRFPSKSHSFRDWARALKTYASGKEILKELPYWRNVEQAPVSSLPADTPLESKDRCFGDMDSVSVTLDAEWGGLLLKQVHRAYRTQVNDILLAALGLAVKEWAGMERVLVNLEGHGREELLPGVQIDRTVGWFTTQYPVLLEVGEGSGEDTAGAVMGVKETLRRVPHKGIGYGILRYLAPGENTGEEKFQCVPEIAFNYLGQFDEWGKEGEAGGVFDTVSGISAPGTGENIAHRFPMEQKLIIEGAASGGVFTFSFYFNTREYRVETVTELARLYRRCLERIIRHCQEQKETRLTPSDLGYPRLSPAALENLTRRVREAVGEEVRVQRIYPLTPLQSEVYHFSRWDPGLCFVWNRLSLEGKVDREFFEAVLRDFLRDYDVCRGVFVHEPPYPPLRVVLDREMVEIEYRDVSHLGDEDREVYFRGFRRMRELAGFDIFGGPLMHIVLFRISEQQFELVWNFHHILMNGGAFSLMFKQFLRVYGSLHPETVSIQESRSNSHPVGGPGGAAPWRSPRRGPRRAAGGSFDAYVRWLEGCDREAGFEYWRRYLDGYRGGDSFSGLAREGRDGYSYCSVQYECFVDEEISSALWEIAARCGVTRATLFKVLWARLLRRYFGGDDVLFGTVVSGRPPEIDGVETITGLLVNVVPVRVNFGAGGELEALLPAVQEREAASAPYPFLPLSEVEAEAGLPRRCIDHLLVVEDASGGIEEQFTRMDTEGTGFRITGMENDEKTNFDFTVGVFPGAGTRLLFLYNSTVYKKDVVRKIAKDFIEVMGAAAGRIAR